MPRSREIRIAAGIAWCAIAFGLADRLRELAVDDFYITYRFAWNLLHGLGFVFNPGERVYGLTDPGYGLLLALVGSVIKIPIPALGSFLTGWAIAGTALVLLDEQLGQAEPGRRVLEALAGGSLAVVSSVLWVNQGAGVFWALLLLLLAARLGNAGRRAWLAGALAGLAVWMRPDAVLGVAILCGLLWGEERRLPWRFALVSGLVVLAGALAAWGYFGALLPNTLAAKQGLGEGSSFRWAGVHGFWPRLVPILPRHWGSGWPWIAVAGGLGHLPLFRRSGRAGRCLAAYSLALAVAYPLLGVPFSFWYVLPTAFGVLYGLPFLAGEVGRSLAGFLRRAERERAGPLAAVLALAILVPLLPSLLRANFRWLGGASWQPHLITYRAAALWLRDRAEEGDDLAYVEIGVWGYYCRCTVVDLLGLVTPSSVPYARRGDLAGAFRARPTRWVAFHDRGGMRAVVAQPWFGKAYEEVVRFGEEGKELVLYRRYPGSTIPPARPPAGGPPGKRGRLPAASPPTRTQRP